MLKEILLNSTGNNQIDHLLMEELKGFIFNSMDRRDERTEMEDDDEVDPGDQRKELADEEDLDDDELADY